MKPLQTQPTPEHQPDRVDSIEPIFPAEERLDAPPRKSASSGRQRVDQARLAALPVLVLFL